MCDLIAHRGPDDFGLYVDGHVGIGTQRLSIIDLGMGQQPIANEDGTIRVVFNGEIYNFRQLREELKARNHKFRTKSDTEVIVHLYEEFGEAFVNHLRGMFAFAIWDARERLLLLARDRMGIKPLYYAETREGLRFASELKALFIDDRIPRDLDPAALGEYFSHLCVPGDLTIFKAVRKLPPAHILVYRQGQVRLTRYWHVQPLPDERRTEDEWIEQLRVRLYDAISTHMIADVPVGAFLSGGLDSGAMVALMAQATSEPIRTFTVGFSTAAGRFDERVAARAVATRNNTAHQECLLEADVTQILPYIVRAFDEPFADSSAIPNWLICQETARHVKVALSGLGGDELFGGYERYVGLQFGEIYQRIPRPLRLAISKLTCNIQDGNGSPYLRDRLKRFVAAGEMSSAERYRSFIAAFSDVKEILRSDLHQELCCQNRRYEQVIHDLAIHHTLNLGLFVDLYLYLPDDLLTLTDRVSMAHSLEVRVPFLDHELVEFMARMPARFKVRGARKKFLYRKAITPWLPKGHLKRSKQGFSVPMAAWLRGPLRPMLSDLVTSQEWRESPWLNHSAVRQLVEEHLTGRVNHEVRLWAIICFREWERQYVSTPNPRGEPNQR
jgi:asparagine synthase (glutamine-hydrolysing)